MTTGQWIVLGIFAAGLACSLTLLTWLVRSLRRERLRNTNAQQQGAPAPEQPEQAAPGAR